MSGARLTLGDLPERFQVVRVLGRGGMGAVVLARDQETRRSVAIKVVLDAGHPELRARLEREAQILARLEHPHVVRLYDRGEIAAGPYLVEEYIEGTSLEELLEPKDTAGPAAPLDLLSIMFQAAEGLEAIHRAGLLHRDLKPGNILVERGGRVLLTDFGIAFDPERTRLTREGVAMGTLAYMAPELLAGRAATPASDWFAWGVTLHEVLLGRLPYDTSQVMRCLLEDTPWPDLALPEDLDPPLGALLGACLDPRPERRPADLDALHDLRAGRRRPAESPPGVPLARAPAPSLDPGPHRRWAAPLAALAVAVAVLVLGALGRAPDAAPQGSGGAAPPRGPEEVRAALHALRSAVDGDPEVVAAMALNEGRHPEQSNETWRRGRRAYRKLVGPWLAAEPPGAGAPALASMGLDIECQEDAARLAVVESLLSRNSRFPELPLFTSEEDTGFVAYARRGVRTREEPMFGVPLPLGTDRTVYCRGLLERAGYRWRALRSRADVTHRGPDGVEMIRWGLRPQNPSGEGYTDFFDGKILLVASSIRQSSFQYDDTEISLRPHPVEGALRIALGFASWRSDLLLGVALVGRRETRRTYLEVPEMIPNELPGFLPANGMLLEFGTALVPEGLRRIELTAIGLQPIGSPGLSVKIRDVFQQVGGPDPFERRADPVP